MKKKNFCRRIIFHGFLANAQGRRIVVIIDAKKIQGSFGSWWDNARCDVTHAVYSPFFHPIFIALNNNFNRAIFLADSSLSLCRDYYITSDKRSSSQSDDVLAKSNNNNNNDDDAIHEATRRFPWLSNEIAIYKSLTIKLRNVQMKK